MELLNKIVKGVSVVAKYALIATAITKALQTLDEELKKINLEESKPKENDNK